VQETKRQTKGPIPISIPLRAYHLDGAVNRNPILSFHRVSSLLAVLHFFRSLHSNVLPMFFPFFWVFFCGVSPKSAKLHTSFLTM
jgi:hypothetical protein